MNRETDLPGRLATLSHDERRVLTVLVAVGGASLSPEELADLAEVDLVGPVLARLESLGMVRRNEDERRSLEPGLVPFLRRAWNIVDTADRVLRGFISIAEDGRLTLADLDAILNIGTWAADAGRLTELLTLLRAVERGVSVTRRVEAWLEIVQRARKAAHDAGDRDAEKWAEEQLRVCEPLSGALGAKREQTKTAYRRFTTPGLPRLALAGGLLFATAGAGFALGLAVAGTSEGEGGLTVDLPGQTLTVPGDVVTVPGATVTNGGETVTLPGDAVTLRGETLTLPGDTVTLPGETVTVTVIG